MRNNEQALSDAGDRFDVELESPLGPLQLVASDAGLVGIYLSTQDEHDPRRAARRVKNHPILEQARAQLAAYFAWQRQSFSLPLAPEGTPFQRSVWAELSRIPFGETCSYLDIATRLGRPTATRAVGAANGQNPLSIVVPCHRVIGANGTLTGYAGGLKKKRWLLAHEAQVAGFRLTA